MLYCRGYILIIVVHLINISSISLLIVELFEEKFVEATYTIDISVDSKVRKIEEMCVYMVYFTVYFVCFMSLA